MDPQQRKPLAIDAAVQAFACRCGRRECEVSRLAPFRDHVAGLYRSIALCHEAGLLPSYTAADKTESSWSAVTYALQMAASLNDVSVDTAFVDPMDSWSWCEPVADFENAHSEMAARYFAGAITFNFIWGAYESAIRVTARDRWARAATAVRGAKLAALLATQAEAIPIFPRLTRGAQRYCVSGGGLNGELSKLSARFPTVGSAESAAELARVFRNHLAHGGDAVPIPDTVLSGSYDAEARVYRLFAVARVLLMLVQLFASTALTDSQWLPTDDGDDDEEGDDLSDSARPRSTAVEILTSVHLRSRGDSAINGS